MLPLYLPTSIAGFSRKLLYEMVFEKNEKYKEYQKILGVSDGAYVSGHLICNYFKGFIISGIISGACFGSGFGNMVIFLLIKESFLVLSGYFIYVIGTTHQSLFLTTFFSKPESSAEIGTFILSISSSLFYLVFFKFADSHIALILASLFPQSAVTLCIVKVCGLSIGIWEINIEAYETFLMLIFDAVLYFLLYVYCDSVIPNEYGVNKSPLYFLDPFRRLGKRLKRILMGPTERIEFLNVEMNEGLKNDEISLSHTNENIDSKVIIKRLSKTFNDVKAVNDLSFSMQKGKLLCLLGHNGAGKTTTINLMTGLIRKDEGEILFFGKDFDRERDEIRKEFGFCPQKDIIYPKLTTKEHLNFVGMIKELPKSERKEAINSISYSLGLNSFLDQKAGTLSGGQKRRLSLAMSLVGNTKLIFLDEPTSGLDPLSRDELWSLISKLKDEGKTLLLTTHYLEEADHLADNVLILSNGRHYIEGSPDEIKKQLCKGYTLTIFGFDLQSENFKDFRKSVSNTMEKFQIDEINENFNSFKLTLPFSKSNIFSQLFFELEKLQDHFSFEFSLEMHTLEDAFLQIGLETQPFESFNINTNEFLTLEPKFSLKSQVYAIFMRKFYFSFRKMSNLFMMFLPIIYILIGSFVQNYIFGLVDKDSKNDPYKEQAKKDFNTLAIFIIQGYCFKSSIFLVLPVFEKEYKIKHLLMISGCRRLSYWFGNFVFDAFIYSFGIAIFFLSMIMMKQEALLEHIGYLSKCLITFGPALILYSYAFSKFFDKGTSAYKIFPLINFFVGYMVPSIVSQVFFFNGQIKIYHGYVEIFFLTFSPFFALDKLFGKLSFMQTGYFDSANSYFLALMLQAMGYLILVYIFESERRFKNSNSPLHESNSFFEIHNLSKKYPKSSAKAVDNLSLKVEKGDVMGVLGPNGAGKSTTFNSILGVIKPDEGEIFLQNKKINSLLQIHSLKNSLVLQDECLWAHMTPEEHLQFYLSLKGIESDNKIIISYLREFGLQEYLGKFAEKLSGGNRRKLSLALACLITPDLFVLDEPTNGIDIFIKKRFYSRILSLQDSVVLLTTHSLAECEVLCNKIAIIFKGNIVEKGELNEVKKRYLDKTKVSFKSTSNAELRKFIIERYEGMKVLKEEGENYFSMEFSSKERMSKICEQLNEMQELDLISDFSITQSTLQQIFVRICKEQEEVEILN